MDLDLIDAERGGPLWVRERGRDIVLPAASALHWKTVVVAASNPHYFHQYVWPADAPLTAWKLDAAHRGWVRHNGIPEEPAQLQRLVKTMEKYYAGIEYDLRYHLGVSAGQFWRERRWRELLECLDHLPPNSHMYQLLTSDEEHMEQVVRAQKGPGDSRPSMSQWGQLESMIATLIDAVNRNTAVNQGIANPKGPKPTFQPFPRPYSAADKVRRKVQKEEHESMVRILLRNREE